MFTFFVVVVVVVVVAVVFVFITFGVCVYFVSVQDRCSSVCAPFRLNCCVALCTAALPERSESAPGLIQHGRLHTTSSASDSVPVSDACQRDHFYHVHLPGPRPALEVFLSASAFVLS